MRFAGSLVSSAAAESLRLWRRAQALLPVDAGYATVS
jgi:hypothetical protein